MSHALLYQTGRHLMSTYALLALRMDIQRRGPLPTGAKILAPNHPTTIDPFLMTTLTRERVHILVTESAFKLPVFGRYLRATGHIPVVASNGRAAFDAAADLLRAGETIALFPEGALSPLDGGVNPGHTGVARLALLTGAPVIPVGIALDPSRVRLLNTGIQTNEGQAEVARLYLRGPYAVTTGAPIYLTGEVEDRPRVRLLTDQLMQHIAGLAQRSTARLSGERTFRPALDSTEFIRIG